MANSVFILVQIAIMALLVWKKPRLVLRACSALERVIRAVHPDLSQATKSHRVRSRRSGTSASWRELVAPTDAVECDLVAALTQLGCAESLSRRIVLAVIDAAEQKQQPKTFNALFPICAASASTAERA